MPSWSDVLACGATAALFWIVLGFALGRVLLPRPLALGFAPALGFAVHSAVMLPVHAWIGLSPFTVRVAGGVALLASLVALTRRRGPSVADKPAIPTWAWPGAVLIAGAVAAAILPKDGGTILAAPIVEHAKVAIVDEIARLGLPPGNPFFAAQGPRLPHDYLWHFAAAEVELAMGASGWTADAALTGVTAFASLSAMIALAVWWSGQSTAALWVLALALTGSLRPLIEFAVPRRVLDPWLLAADSPGAWLSQATWGPQHLASATCALVAAVLIGQLARAPHPLHLVVLALVAAAAVQSSTHVGGIALGLSTLATAYVLTGRMRERRLAFCLSVGLAAVTAFALAAPLLRDQWAATAARGIGAPLAFMPVEVFGPAIPAPLRRLMDLPGFWLVYLVIGLPAIYVTGAFALRRIWRAPAEGEQFVGTAVVVLAVTSLVVSWLLAGPFGNEDLGSRASLPPILVLTAAAAASLARWLSGSARIAALVALVSALPAGALMLKEYLAGSSPRSEVFAGTPAMWEAVRRHTSATARLANNPRFLEHMTPRRANISWALLADRRSCFASDDLVDAFVPLPHLQRQRIDAEFVRLFAGEMPADEAGVLLLRHGCDAALLTAQDGAWARDPFPVAGFRLAADREGAWRIYVRVGMAENAGPAGVSR